jgi:hypothetical protein
MKKRTRVYGGGMRINFTYEGLNTVYCCDQADWEEYELKMKISAYGVPDELINSLARAAYSRGSNDEAMSNAENQ